MLCTYSDVSAIPGMQNIAARPVAWVNALIGAADRAVKMYTKRDLELTAYVAYHDGQGQRDLVMRQYPVWMGANYLDSSMNGVVLPQATITVTSTAGFHPGTFGNPNAQPPAVGLCVGINQWTWINYTGTTATTFTGCTGGVGTLSTNPGANSVTPFSVYSPVIHFDPGAYGGQVASGFGPKTQLAGGVQYFVLVDQRGEGANTPLPLGGQASKRGLIRNSGGAGTWYGGFPGSFPGYYTGSKLAGSRLPVWPQCDGGIRVQYTAGFLTPPFDLSYATAMLVSQMIRVQPTGANLSNEGLGQYTYGTLVNGDNPEMGEIRRVLASYRESSWAQGF